MRSRTRRPQLKRDSLGGVQAELPSMPGYTFTDDVRRALQTAREEAAARRQACVAPEHILLAFTSQGAAAWSTVFKQLAVDRGALADR